MTRTLKWELDTGHQNVYCTQENMKKDEVTC